MSEAKVTSKGQMPIPKAVREPLQLGTGDRVYFKHEADGSVQLIARNQPLSWLSGLLKSNVKGIRIEQMDPGSLDLELA
jgi:AbrB family looped-hinge helix DNA binding protein